MSSSSCVPDYQQQLRPVVPKGRLFFSDWLASWGAFSVCQLFAHPMETLRVRWQTLGQTPMHTLRHDGVRSLYAGITAPVTIIGPSVSLGFAALEKTKPYVISTGLFRSDTATAWYNPWRVVPGQNVSIAEILVAGHFVGAIGTSIMCPVLTVRVQQQNSAAGGKKTTPASQIVRNIAKVDGARGFYRGSGVMVVSEAVSRGWMWASYAWIKAAIDATQLTGGNNAARDAISAGVSGLVFALIAFPANFVATRIMAVPLTAPHYGPNAHRYANVRRCVRHSYREGGLRMFYRGGAIAAARSVFGTAIQLPTYDLLKPQLRRLVIGGHAVDA